MAVKGYDVERKADKTIYRCKDQYDNYYIFNTAKVLDYTILLDIYTIEQELNQINNEETLFKKKQELNQFILLWLSKIINYHYFKLRQ